jgi:hypothetical protein
MLSMKFLRKRYYCQPIILSSDFTEFLSDSIRSFLQQEDGSEPKNDDGSNFQFSPVAPVVLFGKHAPPLQKASCRFSPALCPKRKRPSDAVAPRAHTKVRKMLVGKIRKDVGLSSTNQEAPITSQVWTAPLVADPLNTYILT